MSMSYQYTDENTGEVIENFGMENMLRKPHYRLRVQTFASGESKTQQSHKDTCDVNNIIKRFDRTGQLPVHNGPEGMYGDVSELNGYYGEILDKSEETIATANAFIEEAQKQTEESPTTTDQPMSESEDSTE